ncbi:MAG: hypothetical protein JXR46_17100 [Calditrichaceae bacterium]|nr:hypothetical protein [Calditrichaceae bacterium]MBN2710766.1 hypothetical protein [Calditrichaceae bacterium]RQV95715.1 MAG: hypothetical protein EH224_06795 [Calditrichota bacterium]
MSNINDFIRLMEILLNFFKDLKKRIYFKDGLIILLLFVNFIYYNIIKSLADYLLEASKFLKINLTNEVFSIFYLISILVISTIIWIIWLRIRTIRKFKKNEIGIIFAPDYPENLEDDVKKIYDSLIHEIKPYELGIKFSIKKLPPNRRITDVGEAKIILEKYKGITAVWGIIDKEGVERKSTGFSKIYFTHIYQPSLINFKTLADRIIPTIQGKKWKIDERNLNADRYLIARDISLVVRNLIGISLYINRRFDDAAKIFLPLCTQLKSLLQSDNNLNLRKFYTNVKIDCAAIINLSTTLEYEKYLYNDSIYNIPTQLCNKWIKNINCAIKLDSQNSSHYVMKAIYLFLVNDFSNSLKTCKKAIELAPKADAGPSFSIAFLYAFMEDFEKARREYRRSLAKKTSYDDIFISRLLMFIDQTIEKFPGKIQFHIILGILEYYRGDKEKGLEEIHLFISKAKGNTKMLPFLNEANRILLK